METPTAKPRKSVFKKIIFWTLGIIIGLILIGFISFKVSPWPSALLIRKAFNDDGVKVNEALLKYVPKNIASSLNEHYNTSSEDAYLDVYYPADSVAGEKSLSTVVWIHGGGFIGGDKSHLENYCKILAGKGYTVASLNYSLAPGENFPVPVHQMNDALAYLKKNAAKFHIDTLKIILAGDSGGANIAASEATVITVPSFAAALGITPSLQPISLKGVILFCGPYDIKDANFDGPFGGFMTTVLWSYSGTKNFLNDTAFARVSVVNYVSSAFPPAFISVGNADPLKSHSVKLSQKLQSLGVPVENLFFADDYTPALSHEYQFNLEFDASKQALNKITEFVAAKTN